MSFNIKEVGDLMKSYESVETSRKVDPTKPFMVRLDGKSFSKYTKNLVRPFDERFSNLMVATTQFLMEETNAQVAYTSSDEISLGFMPSEKENGNYYFDGKLQKLVSITAAFATGYFNKYIGDYIPEKSNDLGFFDSRVFGLPDAQSVVDCLIWREVDCKRNSVSKAAASYFSHNELHGKGTDEMFKMLHSVGVDWTQYPAEFKRGTYFRRAFKDVKFTAQELENLPEKHAARSNPDLTFKRHVIEKFAFHDSLLLMVNDHGFLFNGETPIFNG